jgi:hypothetical protein
VPGDRLHDGGSSVSDATVLDAFDTARIVVDPFERGVMASPASSSLVADPG